MAYDERVSSGFDHARAGCDFLGAGHSVSGGRFYGLLVLNDAVLSSATGRGSSTDNLSRLVGPILVAGTYIPVALAGVGVTSGLVQVFKEPN